MAGATVRAARTSRRLRRAVEVAHDERAATTRLVDRESWRSERMADILNVYEESEPSKEYVLDGERRERNLDAIFYLATASFG